MYFYLKRLKLNAKPPKRKIFGIIETEFQVSLDRTGPKQNLSPPKFKNFYYF